MDLFDATPRETPVTAGEFEAFVRTHPEWRRDHVPSLFADNQSIFEEGLEVIQRLWAADGRISHHGKHYRFDVSGVLTPHFDVTWLVA